MKLILRFFLIAALGIGGSVAWLVANEADYLFFPARAVTATPAAAGLQFSEVNFKAADGVALHGWYMPHQRARFTLLHLHGNAGNISDRLNQYRHWHALGLAVFAFDYRGYGASEGSPSEDGLYADAQAAWAQLTRARGLVPGSIIIAGRSLGAAIAARLAGELGAAGKGPAGLALEVPFTSIPDISADYYPWLPLRWFVRNRFDTRAAVRNVKTPLLLISAKSDEIIPDGMAEKIFAAAAGQKLSSALPGGHNDFDVVSERAYFRLWQRWINSLKPPAQADVQWVINTVPFSS